MTSARKRRSALEAQLPAAIQPEGADTVRAEMRAREIRDHARSLGRAELHLLILNAVKTGDRETITALLDVPPSLRLIDEGQAKEARRLLARTFDAKAAQELGDITGGLQAVEGELAALREDVERLGQPEKTTEQRIRGASASPPVPPGPGGFPPADSPISPVGEGAGEKSFEVLPLVS